MNYQSFIEQKSQAGSNNGFAPVWMPDFLFDFQADMVEWAIRKGRAAIFADCTFLETVRGAARMICRRQGTVTADDVRKWADENGIEPTGKNAWGAVFKSPDFVAVGFTTSKQVQGHGNRLVRWALREQTLGGKPCET